MRCFTRKALGRWILSSFVAWCSLHGLAPASVLRYEKLPSSARPLDDFEAVGRIQQSLRDGDAVRDLGYLEGGDYVFPYGINDQGQIVGTATDVTPSSANPYWRAVVSENGRWVNIAPDYPHWAIEATDINNKGQVVGGNTNGMWEGQAFLYESGKFQPLGTLGGRTSVARSINEAGWIVGSSDAPRNPIDWGGAYDPIHAMLFAEGRMYNLNDLTEDLGDWNLREASFITEDGWILTWGHPRNGGYTERNWLKPILDGAENPDPDSPSTPLPQTGPNVETPEPISVALWLVLAGGTALWRRRRTAVVAPDSGG